MSMSHGHGLSICQAMGSEGISHKHHYDISMSKRTRKPAKIQDELQNLTPNRDDLRLVNPLPLKAGNGELESPATKEFESNDHKSLKQLINGEGKAEKKSEADEGSRGRNSLGQHFTEEQNNLQMVRKQQQDGLQLQGQHFTEEQNNLQMVRKQQQDGLQGVKFKKLVGKFLRNLIKGSEQHQLKNPTKKSLL